MPPFEQPVMKTTRASLEDDVVIVLGMTPFGVYERKECGEGRMRRKGSSMVPLCGYVVL